jgi:tetratricopeptide (TPR) repeat protein/pSer/pThr/pTyr-binding forkhead associated (FHA) protein
MTDDATLVETFPPPRLVVKMGERVLQEVTVQVELSIGRAEDNDLRLTGLRVSRHHARLVREGTTYILTDLGSANGTLVNDARLTGPHTLRHDERITIGDTELIYVEPGATAQDTITSPVVVPPPPTVPSSSRAEGGKRGLRIGVVLVAAVVLLILTGAALYLLVPDLPERIGLVTPATQTPQVETVAPTALATTATPVETPPASPAAASPTPSPVASDETGVEIDELMIQAEALTERSKFEDAIAIYQELTQQAPNDARSEVGWAWTLILDGEVDEALVHARRAAELDPSSADAAAVLARAYVETGYQALALAAAQKAVQLDPGNGEAQAALAEAHMVDGQIQDAVDAADLALVQDSQNANAHRVRGWLYHMAGNMGKAASELQVTAGLQPELWLRRHELGVLLLEAGDYTTAIIAFQDALGIRPKAVTYTAIGEAYYRLEQYDQAKASLRQAFAEGAEDVETYSLMAATGAHQGNCDEAQTYYEQALALDPTSPLALEAKEICEVAGPPPSPSPAMTSLSVPTPTITPQPPPKATKPPAPPAALSGRIAFPMWNSQAYRYDTYVAKADGSGRHIVVDGMHQPAFSPSGEWLAVNGVKPDHMNLFIVRPNGSELKKVTDFMEDKLPSWSPDSKGLVLATTRDQPGRPKRIYVIDDVVSIVRAQKGRVLASGDKPIQGEYATWMPNGKIAYKGCDYTVTPQQCGLFTISAGGGPFRQLTQNGEDSAPAGYGTRIAFMSSRDGNWEIYVMNEDGSGVNRLTNNGAHDGLPTWSPDGKTIAFVSNEGGPWAIWAMSPEGSNRRKLFDIGDGGLASEWQNERISWGP